MKGKKLLTIPIIAGQDQPISDKGRASRPSARYPSLHCQHRMSLQPERMLNIIAVILFRAKAHTFFEKACLNQIRTKGLDHVEPNPGCLGVEKIAIAASNKLITRVIRNINQPC